jgi:hypothetical protein
MDVAGIESCWNRALIRQQSKSISKSIKKDKPDAGSCNFYDKINLSLAADAAANSLAENLPKPPNP